MKVCIVGNGFSPSWEWDGNRNWSPEIDDCDVVVRLNGCKFYHHGWTGWRTDVLIVRSPLNPFGRRLASHYDITIPREVSERVKRVVCVGGLEDDLSAICNRYGWESSIASHADASDLAAVVASEARLSAGCQPTLGAMAIEWERRVYPDAELWLAGFVWSDADNARDKKVHDWAAERAWIYRLVADGAVNLFE